jgi:N-acetylglucosamine transport system substrate-binding protein
MLLPWAQDIGGIQVINDIQNLKPGAWKDPAILQAAQMLCTLRDKGDFQKGAVGLSHTESQSEFLLGHAAFIPCGTWLPSEMKKNWPGTDRVRVTQPVGVTGGKGDPTAVIVEIEPWMVPAKAKNPNAAVAYYKYITSLDKAKQFVSEKGTFTAIKGSDQTKIPDTLADAATAFRASKTIWSYTARQWYPAMEKEVENSITAMLNGEITAAQFCDRAEAAAQKTRDDSSISKHKVE